MIPIKYNKLKEGDVFVHYFKGIDHHDVYIAKYIKDSGEPNYSITCNIISGVSANNTVGNEGWSVSNDNMEPTVGDLMGGSTYPNFTVEAFLLEPDEILAVLSEQL